LVADYVEGIKFIMPGQTDVIEVRQTFREALNDLGNILRPGFEIKGLRHIEGNNEVVSIIEWKSNKVADSQLVVLFKFNSKNIYEERWFIDTEQWKNSF